MFIYVFVKHYAQNKTTRARHARSPMRTIERSPAYAVATFGRLGLVCGLDSAVTSDYVKGA